MSESGFIVTLSHDIDFVKKTYQYITHDLLKFKFSNLRKIFNRTDPFWTFDKIRNIEDKAGCRSTFFFLQETIPWRPYPVKGWNLSLGKYKFSDSKVRKIIKELDRESWEIALHGSFNSYRSKELLQKEKNALEEVIGKKVNGVRQHFLNLDIPLTWQIQKEAGFYYDASLGKKRDLGFYQNYYTPIKNQESGIIVIPLTLMDTYLRLVTRYDISRAWPLVLKIIDEAEANNAVLSVLWHNNFFNDSEHPGYTNLYNKIIWECKNRGAEFLTSMEVYERFSKNEQAVLVSNLKKEE